MTMCFLEDYKKNIDVASKKNEWIADTKEAYVTFAYKEYTSCDEIQGIYGENDYLYDFDVVVFGEHLPQNDEMVSNLDVINCVDMNVCALVIKRDLFQNVGCFNEKLDAMIDYEFLVRASQCANIMYVNVDTTSEATDMELSREFADGPEKYNSVFATVSYVIRANLQQLKAAGMLERVFNHISSYASSVGALECFNAETEKMLSNRWAYENIARNTAPFFIISGDDTCHGVLRGFADCLADSLVKMGQAVITTNHRYGKFESFDGFDIKLYKGIIGFQSTVLEKDFFRQISSPKLQFWFDNPGFFTGLLHNLPDDYYILSQDQYYADYVREYYDTKNAMQFPPAGIDAGLALNIEREYGLVFIGAYNPIKQEVIADEFQQRFMEYMIAHPCLTFESGLSQFLKEQEIIISKEKFCEIFNSLHMVCKNIINHYRHCVVETILSAGIQMDVFGDTWYSYEGVGKENLIIHPAVSVKESLEVWGHAKIGLNVMTWHKAGMTERIANIMLSGAVCISDETRYLEEHFEDDQEIVLFKLDQLQELPEKINKLLKDEEYRKNIAHNAYVKASKEHIWDTRAKELLALLQ